MSQEPALNPAPAMGSADGARGAVSGGMGAVEPRVLLIGMMAVGKSTVGLAVAGLTGWPYLDNDAVFETVNGRAAADVLASDGVVALRRAEAGVLRHVLSNAAPLVAGAAGGTIEDVDLRREMRAAAFVVHLRAPIPVLVERVEADAAARQEAGEPPRPWVGDDPRRALERLHQGRADLYVETAHLVVDVVDRVPDEIAREIVEAAVTAS